jgi:hypothetical protein
MLVLELKSGWIYLSTDNKKELDVAINFLQENRKIIDDAKGNARTIYDVRKKYEKEIV